MKKILYSLLMLCTVSLCAENLIKNSEIDSGLSPEFRMEGKAGFYKLSPFTEDLTGNKCAKLDIISYMLDKAGKKRVNCGVMIGGEKGVTGFPAKPDTTYKFSVEL
ncbi:MAG: hypothetical protein WC071_13115, partial [Victivallaceae bacterium]